MRYAVLAFLSLASVFVLPSCKGEKGDPGQPGATGPSGAPQNAPDILSFEGNITSDNQFIFLGDFGDRYALSVYIGDITSFTEMPYFLPGFGVNTFFVADGFGVRLFNAQLAAATRYRISLVRIGAAPGLSSLE